MALLASYILVLRATKADPDDRAQSQRLNL